VLFRRLVTPTFIQIRVSLGNTAAAVSVTRAVFVEAWLLAPRADGDDALAWLSTIASRRVADRLRAVDHQPVSPLEAVYESHVDGELLAILRPDAHTAFTRIEAGHEDPAPVDVEGAPR
jgi:DNA-directed RNA polymerase specialized sigma24 family protein